MRVGFRVQLTLKRALPNPPRPGHGGESPWRAEQGGPREQARWQCSVRCSTREVAELPQHRRVRRGGQFRAAGDGVV